MITLGIDIGSITTKAAIISDKKLLAVRTGFTGYNAGNAGTSIFEAILCDCGLNSSDVDFLVSTGYGRNSIEFADNTITEITCHAAGARFLMPDINSILDIGGQDSKVIALLEDGRVRDFAMNDKCAAGTGRFLEVMARTLELDLEDFSELSMKSVKRLTISNTCTVFAESEVVSLIAKGESREDIIAGIHDSIADRILAMSKRVGIIPPMAFTGGVARNQGLAFSLEQKLGYKPIISSFAQENGAIGAAVLASDMKEKGGMA